MDYCGPRGLPHSVFLDWDPDDQDKAVAWSLAQAEICGGCGTRRAEWREDRFAYVAEQWRCPGCELIEQAQEGIPEGKAKGIKTFLVPTAMALDDEEHADGLPGLE